VTIPVEDEMLPYVAAVLDMVDPAMESDDAYLVAERLARADPVTAIVVATSIATALVMSIHRATQAPIAEIMAQLRIELSGDTAS
jgi:hypothetical protein